MKTKNYAAPNGIELKTGALAIIGKSPLISRARAILQPNPNCASNNMSHTCRFQAIAASLPGVAVGCLFYKPDGLRAASRLAFTLKRTLRFAHQNMGARMVALALLACVANAQTPASGTVTIPGVPNNGWCDGYQWGDFWQVTVNGVTAQFTAQPQWQSWTTAGIAQGLTASINSNISFVTASASQDTITITTNGTGSAVNYPLSTWAGDYLALPNGDPVPFFDPNCVGYAWYLPTSGPTLTGGVDGLSGYINPKYLIMGVTYAPPGGSASSASYQTTNVVGNTSTITDSFTNAVSVTVSLSQGGGFFGFIKGKSTATLSAGWTQKMTNSNAITVTKTSSTTFKTPGVPNVYSPVNHDYDIVWLWLNPVALFTFTNGEIGGPIVWNGYGYDLNDPLQDVDVWPVYVGYLNGDFGPLDPEDAGALSRSWVTTQTFAPGDGPAITSADFPNILKADPFAYNPYDANSGYVLTLTPGTYPATSADGRFTASTPGDTGPQSIPYAQAPPSSTQGIQETYQSVYSTQNQATQTTTNTYTVGFGLDQNVAANFLDFASASGELNISWKLTWANTSQTQNTNTNTQTDTVVIVSPPCPAMMTPCNPEYTEPHEFAVYQDNLYGTFLFWPNPYFSISSIVPAKTTVAAGSAVSFTVSTLANAGYSGTSISFNVSGLPAGASFNQATVAPESPFGLLISTTPATPTGSYPLTISATDGSQSYFAYATLVVSAAVTSGSPAPQAVAGSLQEVSVARDGTVFGINGAGQVYTFDSQSQNWKNIPGSLSQVVAGANGVAWGLNSGGEVYRFDSTTQSWAWIQGNLSQVRVGSDGDVWGLNSASQIYHFDSSKNGWDWIPGSLSQLAVGFDGAVWGLNSAGEIYRFSPGTQRFEQVSGALTEISVGADGEVWGLNSANHVYRFNPLTQSWDDIPGSLAKISVGSAINIWGLDSSGNIYSFNLQNQSWVQIAGNLKQISAAANGAVWGLDASNNIYQFLQAVQPMQIWHQLPGTLSQLAVASDGNTWGVNTSNQIYTWNALTESWTLIPGELSEISVGRNGNVWGLNRSGDIYTFSASTQSWTWIPGNLARIAVGGNGEVWGLNSAHQIYHYDASAQSWTWVPGELSQISVGEDGTVWGVNSTNQIYRFNSSTQDWDAIAGELVEIAVGSQKNVWGINSAGQIYQFDTSTQSWDWMAGSVSQIAVAFDGTVWGVDSSNQIWRYDPQTQAWVQVSGSLTSVALATDAVVWGLDADNNVYRWY